MDNIITQKLKYKQTVIKFSYKSGLVVLWIKLRQVAYNKNELVKCKL